ncbi:trypsin-like serine protease [Pigmentibacter sp. JX0631]|uniref:trypsin-like serine protease n=1 Tax=Pigmentibacter sp. JX0631 TaxID=2976982 RepID=UPI0024689A1D|nr:trypsin-like serine protease [Pigmentibacter sp. JX0631]WGL59856.1 trypsin-like serine protease [Pigmentibacter sp. JX0631]
MKKILSSAFAGTSLLLLSCKEPPKNGVKNSEVCTSLPGEFSVNKISNGCDVNEKNILGNNSTVYLSMGCTGTVVSPHFIITASHCLYDKNTGIYEKKENIKVVFGNNAYNVFDIKTASVKNYYTNSYYTAPSNYKPSLGDIALVETEEDLVKDLQLTPAKIAVNLPHPSQLILNVGYGSTGKFDSKSGGLKRWSISSLGKVEIYDAYSIYSLVNNYFNTQVTLGNVSKIYSTNKPEDTLIITDRITAQQGQTCYGDSGGPQYLSFNGEPLLLSSTQGGSEFWLGKKFKDIIANKEDDCNKLNTSINTRIAPYTEWLNTKMSTRGESLVLVNN